jgi:dihydrodipicolinate synthase/N-acetylneuraminate lyase
MPAHPATNLRHGVYAPILTPFTEDGSEDVDYLAFAAGVARLGKAGVGIVLGGTLGEGPLLDREERIKLTKCAKKTLQDLSLDKDIPLVVGIVAASVRECVIQAEDAASSGADAVYGQAEAISIIIHAELRLLVM